MPKQASTLRSLSFVLLGVLVGGCFVAVGIIFYWRSTAILGHELRQRLTQVAGAAALQFHGEDIDRIHDTDDMQSAIYRNTILRLRSIKDLAPDVRYAYIMRRTDDPMTLAFVADADALSIDDAEDSNGNGVIDPKEALSLPGDSYDISDTPALQHQAFVGPVADDEVTIDQWGAFLSGYAPITYADGTVAGVLGLDVEADTFVEHTRSLVSGFSVLSFLALAVLVGALVAHSSWRRQLALLQRVDRERSALVDLALHQIGTPLSIFKWWVEILEDRYGDTLCKESEACVQLRQGITRLEDVYRALQETHAVSEKQLPMKCEDVSIKQVVNVAVEEMRDRLKKGEHQLTVDVPEDITLCIDSKLIKGVISELLENAALYSPHGKPIVLTVRVEWRRIVVSIRDEGYGIALRDLPHIFQKFYRGKDANKRKPVGNGVGLYIAKGIIEEAGGKIWLHSREDEGTTVSFSLPFNRKKRWFGW